MSIFGKLFRPDQNDSGTLIGHIIAFSGMVLATPDGQALFAHMIGAINPTYAFMVPLALTYFGGAKAGQPPATK